MPELSVCKPVSLCDSQRFGFDWSFCLLVAGLGALCAYGTRLCLHGWPSLLGFAGWCCFPAFRVALDLNCPGPLD